MLAAWLVLAAVLLVLAFVAGFRYAWRRARTVEAARQRAAGPAVAPLPGLASQLIAALDVGALVADAQDRIVLVNPAARAMDVVQTDTLRFPRLASLVGMARTAGAACAELVDLPLDRLGREPVAVAATAVPLDDEEHDGYVGLLLVDVTEQRRLDAVRRDFVANVSHELKTPVGALTLLAEAVQDAAGDPEQVAHFAARMQREGTRLSRLVSDLMELSRVQGTDPLPDSSEVAVEQVVAEAVERSRLAADRRDIEVAVRCEPGLAVRGAQDQLVTAIENLIANAVAYSSAGTQVRVDARGSSDAQATPCVDIAVVDEGVGIAEADLARIFERFYRVDAARSRATGGTGLGLAIVRNIVTNHRGTVAVRSTPGEGSTFTVRLPRVHREAPAAVPQPDPLISGGRS